jgi:hypothetical protein
MQNSCGRGVDGTFKELKVEYRPGRIVRWEVCQHMQIKGIWVCSLMITINKQKALKGFEW